MHKLFLFGHFLTWIKSINQSKWRIGRPIPGPSPAPPPKPGKSALGTTLATYIDKENGRDKLFGELPVIPLSKTKYIDV